ncbi:unnamed protein product [Sympodiomycopsis kandeliae]
MDLLTQVLLALVFVLSVALFVRSSSGSSGRSTAASPPSKQSQQKKKKKSKSSAVTLPNSTASTASAEAPASPGVVSEDAKEDVSDLEAPAAVTTPATSSKAKSKAAKKKAKKAANGAANSNADTTPQTQQAKGFSGEEPSSAPAGPPSFAAAVGASSDSKAVHGTSENDVQLNGSIPNGSAATTPFTPNGSVTYADFEPEVDDDPQEEEEAWTSVGGKGAGRLNASIRAASANGNAQNSATSFASTNPFAVLPSAAKSKTSSSQGRSISIPSSNHEFSNGHAKKASSAATSNATEQTKRQRQNAARSAAAKASKDAEERERQARLDAHRREARLAAAREEEKKRAPKPRSVAANGSKQPTSTASVKLQGQLVWE